MEREASLREIIRKNLISAMERAGINQVQLAKQLGISKGTVNNWVRGNNSPDVDIVPEICSVLGISIISLFSESITLPITEHTNALSDKELEIALAYRNASTDDRIAVEAILRKYTMSPNVDSPQSKLQDIG